MILFSSLEQAVRSGFRWFDWDPDYGLHVVLTERATPRGRVRALAFAFPQENTDLDEHARHRARRSGLPRRVL